MSDVVAARPPVWLRIVAALGLLWNLFGCYAYLQQVGVVPADPSMPPEPMPAWVVGAFAVGVFGGALGALGLVVLKRWSKLLLLISFLAVLASDVWAYVLRDGGTQANLGLSIAVNVIAIVLVWLAFSADSKGQLS